MPDGWEIAEIRHTLKALPSTVDSAVDCNNHDGWSMRTIHMSLAEITSKKKHSLAYSVDQCSVLIINSIALVPRLSGMSMSIYLCEWLN